MAGETNPKVTERKRIKTHNYIKPANGTGYYLSLLKKNIFQRGKEIEQNNPEQTGILHSDKDQES